MYSPRAAWQRALLWFAFCFSVVRIAGILFVLEWNTRKVALAHAPLLVLTPVLVTWTGDMRFYVLAHMAALAAGLPAAELTGMPRARVFTG